MELPELFAVGRREEVGAGGQHLPELDERGAEFGEVPSHPSRALLDGPALEIHPQADVR